MHADALTLELSPDAILAGIENYHGTIIDLDHSLTVPAGALPREVNHLLRKLTELGLNQGDRVVLAVSNGPLFLAALGAVLMRDGTPLLAHAKSPPAELKRLALKFGAKYVISETCTRLAMLGVIDNAIVLTDQLRTKLVCGTLDEDSPEFNGSYPLLPGVPLHPTSGTTGMPKVAVRPAHCALAEAQHYVDTLGITCDDTILTVPPMSHAYAYGMCAMVPLVSGANLVTTRQFNSAQVQHVLVDGNATIFPAVPAMLDVLAFTGSQRVHRHVRCVTCAGAPLSARTAAAFRAKSGLAVQPLYGTTETGGITIAVDEREWSQPGCVGRAMDGVSAQAASVETTAGESPAPGTLHVRSSSMMAGYLSVDGIDDSLIEDGWFDTGDLAAIDDFGSIHLQGRASEMINVAGMKVVPGEVEEVLLLMPAVQEVKVYSGRLASGGQFVKAAIVANSEFDPAAARKHCGEHLIYYKRPSQILVVDSLPKTASGKIVLDQLP